MGDHQISRLVLDESLAPPRGDGDYLAIPGSDADGKDQHPMPGRFLCRGKDIALKIFAVGDQDQDLVVGLIGEHRFRLPDGRGDIGAALGDDRGVHLLQRIFKGLVVSSQRAHLIGVACEGHQPDPVSVQLIDKIHDRKFCPFETVGFDVLGQHALRSVQGKEDIDPLAFDVLPLEAVLRPGQGQKAAEQRGKKDNLLGRLPCGRDIFGQLRQQMGGRKFFKCRPASCLQSAHEEKHADTDEESGEDPEWLRKSHDLSFAVRGDVYDPAAAPDQAGAMRQSGGRERAPGNGRNSLRSCWWSPWN